MASINDILYRQHKKWTDDHGGGKVVSHDSSGNPTDSCTTRIFNDGTYDYLCEAMAGTLTSEAKWRICRIDSSGNMLFADGDGDCDNIADNYLSLSYS